MTSRMAGTINNGLCCDPYICRYRYFGDGLSRAVCSSPPRTPKMSIVTGVDENIGGATRGARLPHPAGRRPPGHGGRIR
jgi:hypothetical protein